MMEIIIIVSILLVLFLILGIQIEILIFAVLCMMELFCLAVTAFFITSAICLLCSKPKTAKFVRIQETEKYGKHAVYQIDGMEYPNAYPTEEPLQSFLCRKQNPTVWLWKGKNKQFVLDRHSLIVIAAGTPFFAVVSILLGYFLIQISF